MPATAPTTSEETIETEQAFSVYDLLPAQKLDLANPDIQYALDCQAERRLRLRGLLGPAACAGLRKKISKRFLASS